MALSIFLQTGDRVQTSPKLTLFKTCQAWKHRGISPSVRVPDVNVWDTFPPRSSSCTDQGGCSSQDTTAEIYWAKMGFGPPGGFDFVLRWRWTEDVYYQLLPIESWPEGMDKTTSWATLSSALGEKGSVFPQSKNHGFSSALKQEERRCFVFTPACSWNRSRANFILVAASDNIENFLRSHLICPNDRCSVNNLAKWCLGTLPCSSSLWLIGAWLTPHSSADSIPGIV